MPSLSCAEEHVHQKCQDMTAIKDATANTLLSLLCYAVEGCLTEMILFAI